MTSFSRVTWPTSRRCPDESFAHVPPNEALRSNHRRFTHSPVNFPRPASLKNRCAVARSAAVNCSRGRGLRGPADGCMIMRVGLREKPCRGVEVVATEGVLRRMTCFAVAGVHRKQTKKQKAGAALDSRGPSAIASKICEGRQVVARRL